MRKTVFVITAFLLLAQTYSLKAQYYRESDWSFGAGLDFDWQLNNGFKSDQLSATNIGFGLTVERSINQLFAIRAMLSVPGLLGYRYDSQYAIYYDKHLRLGVDVKYHIKPLNEVLFDNYKNSLYLLAGGGLTVGRNRHLKDSSYSKLGCYLRFGAGYAYDISAKSQLFGEIFYNTASLTLMAGMNYYLEKDREVIYDNNLTKDDDILENISRRAEKIKTARGNGFVVRPQICTSLGADVGYQINPYVQPYLGVGWSFGLETTIGMRFYTSKSKWTTMYELRISGINESMTVKGNTYFYKMTFISLIDGASYKDFDFGAGPAIILGNGNLKDLITDEHVSDLFSSSLIGVISIGYNFRCYKHRY